MAKVLTPQDLQTVAEALRQGQPVALPTETVYGLAAPALDPRAIAQVFKIKGRPSYDPLIVHVSDASQLEQLTLPLGDLLETTQNLIQAFWPGPLTLVLPKSDRVPNEVTSGLPTVALRMPALELTRQVIAKAGPLAAPSANRFGGISPTRAEHVQSELGDRIPYILDGGPCEVGLESTVVLVQPHGVKLLRPGGISLEELNKVVPVDLDPGTKLQSPGQLDRHYSPRKPLILLKEGESLPKDLPKTGVALLSPQERPWERGPQRTYSAQSLYNDLRSLDDDPMVQTLIAEPCSLDGMGRALMDRLRRASHP